MSDDLIIGDKSNLKGGDWVLIRAKVVNIPYHESVEVELFSKTDQYNSFVLRDCILGKTNPPLIPQPLPGAIVRLHSRMYQRLTLNGVAGWFAPGDEKCYTWEELCRIDTPMEMG